MESIGATEAGRGLQSTGRKRGHDRNGATPHSAALRTDGADDRGLTQESVCQRAHVPYKLYISEQR